MTGLRPQGGRRTLVLASATAPRSEVCGCGCGTPLDPSRRRNTGRPNRFVFRHRLPARIAEIWLTVCAGDDGEGFTTPCWEWTGRRNRHGYGQFEKHGEYYAHRAAWVQSYGAIPDGLWVLHRCDNPPCVRPTHLFLGDAEANTKDMLAKARQFKGRPVDEQAVVDAYLASQSVKKVSRAFRISGDRVVEILRRVGGTEPRHWGQRDSCRAGHRYTEQNTLFVRGGKRQCRTCNSTWARARRERARAS